jgi:hypothetical protein
LEIELFELLTASQYVFVALALLFIKHWYIDFVNQSMDEVNTKGIYMHPVGMGHSFKHGIGTVLVFGVMDGSLVMAAIIGMVDAVAHYHIDWAKMNWGNRDINTPQFWNHLGLDQLAHSLTYLGLVFWAL